MLRIAICDDRPRELDVINQYMTEYLDTHTFKVEMNVLRAKGEWV